MANQAGRERWWKMLGWSFLLGALLDLPFGLGALFAPSQLASILGITPPPKETGVYLDLSGLFLIALGLIYILIWRQPERLAPVAAAATLLRFAGFALFFRCVMQGRADRFFLGIGCAEALLGFAHLTCLRLACGSLVTALWRKDYSG